VTDSSPRQPIQVVLLAWLILAGGTLLFASPRIEDPGLYYDEAFLAQQGRDFVEPAREGVHPPSVRAMRIGGRSFPLRNAAYLGSLKSQLAIPSLALFGSSARVLRVTTLSIGLLGLLFSMLWARQLFGDAVAIGAGVLLAMDPSFHFFSQFEWGPFTSMLLCRAAGLFLVGVAFTSERRATRWASVIAGGAILGLGVYSRADFAVIILGAILGLVLCRRDLLLGALRRERGLVTAGLLAALVTSSPMLLSVEQLLGAGAGMADRGGLAYRSEVMASVLDGSHFLRLQQAGGLFDRIFSGPATATVLIPILALSMLVVWRLARLRAPHSRDAAAFLLVMLTFVACSMLALPGAVRAHHMLNLQPLPQIVVALAGVGLWRREWGSASIGRAARVAVLLALAALLASDATVIHRTRELLHETGGRGRWTHALDDFAEELNSASNAAELTVVSLDWGFHENLLFLSHHIRLVEPIWAFSAGRMRGRPSVVQGDRNTIYLFHEDPYGLFPSNDAFKTAFEGLPEDSVELRTHADGSGQPVFTSARLSRPHRMIYAGAVRIDLD
jgi:hypothetical protein